jgi:hypothetical protein
MEVLGVDRLDHVPVEPQQLQVLGKLGEEVAVIPEHHPPSHVRSQATNHDGDPF